MAGRCMNFLLAAWAPYSPCISCAWPIFTHLLGRMQALHVCGIGLAACSFAEHSSWQHTRCVHGWPHTSCMHGWPHSRGCPLASGDRDRVATRE
ncbi:hypothetical protein Dimus_001062 [Dionaea muscipula]